MNERQMQFRVGVVVFATMIVGGLLATLYDPLPTGWLPWGQSTYRIGIEVPQAPGVGPNSPVRKNGILIGRVNAIEDKGDGVVLHTDVETDRPLLTNQVPHIRTSVLGDATIDFVTTPTNVPPQPLADGAVIPGVVDPQPLDALAKLGDLQQDFADASRALEGAGDEVAESGASRQQCVRRRNGRGPRHAAARYDRACHGPICQHDDRDQRNHRRCAGRRAAAASRHSRSQPRESASR